IGNGRAVDAANTGTATGSNRQVLFNVVAAPGDYNTDGRVDQGDYVKWRKSDDTQAGYDLWRAKYGKTSTVVLLGAGAGSSDSGAGAGATVEKPQPVAEAAVSSLASIALADVPVVSPAELTTTTPTVSSDKTKHVSSVIFDSSHPIELR